MKDKDEARELRQKIRAILMNEWDPIGVKDIPEASDEYDMYVGDICRLVDEGAQTSTIEKYLHWVEVDRMGLVDERGDALLPDGVRKSVVASLKALHS